MTTKNARVAVQNGGSMLDRLHVSKTSVRFEPFETIFAQGDRCAAVMYIERGRVRLSVVLPGRKAAVVAILRAGAFFGEGALAGQRHRRSTAETMTGSTIAIVKTAEMRRRLREESALSDWFRSHMLARNVGIEAALVAQRFNSSEERLARATRPRPGSETHVSSRRAPLLRAPRRAVKGPPYAVNSREFRSNRGGRRSGGSG